MNFTEEIIKKAQKRPNSILVLPESSDERILRATEIISAKKISAQVVLLGKEQKIKEDAARLEVTLPNTVKIHDPETSKLRTHYANQYYEQRKHKGLTQEEAFLSMGIPIFFGTMMLKEGDATALLSGAITATAEVLRPAIRIVGLAKGSKVVSSCFVMESPDKTLGYEGGFIFSDCGIIPRPTSEQLVHITLAAAESCNTFLNTEPIISLLSFSTKGSAEHEEVSRVREAVEQIQKLRPDLVVDGEMQMDAAISARVAQIKAPDSPSAGKSNTLIFPDLNAGNIAYKTAQQFGNMKAYGPFIQGLASPINDLSRGCDVEEIVVAAATTVAQASP